MSTPSRAIEISSPYLNPIAASSQSVVSKIPIVFEDPNLPTRNESPVVQNSETQLLPKNYTTKKNSKEKKT